MIINYKITHKRRCFIEAIESFSKLVGSRFGNARDANKQEKARVVARATDPRPILCLLAIYICCGKTHAVYRADGWKLKLKRVRCKLFLIRTNCSIALCYEYRRGLRGSFALVGHVLWENRPMWGIMPVNYCQRPINPRAPLSPTSPRTLKNHSPRRHPMDRATNFPANRNVKSI